MLINIFIKIPWIGGDQFGEEPGMRASGAVVLEMEQPLNKGKLGRENAT